MVQEPKIIEGVFKHTMKCGIREAPYLVWNTLSRQLTSVLSRPGTSAPVCKALRIREKQKSNKLHSLTSRASLSRNQQKASDNEQYTDGRELPSGREEEEIQRKRGKGTG